MTKDLSEPAVIVNFKAYSEVEGTKALDLAKLCLAVSEESGKIISVCPPMTELGIVARSVDIPVLSQNVDPKTPGSATGWTTPSMVKVCGAMGTLINHSEHKVSFDVVRECVELSRKCGLVTVVCADNVKAAVDLASCHPDFIAVEPPELIGGDISVTTANPKIVKDTVDSVKSVDDSISVLCGAGVKTGEDVKIALELGASGVLLASGVVKSKDPKKTLFDLIKHL